jgi:hypothetical protein|tara:strand:+ start:660 stop:1205 length:546 start_codon:yes stop_codon:yes gene_type:complete
VDYDDSSSEAINTDSIVYHSANTQALLEYSRLNEDLQDLILALSGLIIEPKNGNFIPDPFGKRLMNDQGVKAITLQLKPYFSRSATFGSLKTEFINKKIKTTLVNVKSQLLSSINQKRWELHSADVELVFEFITSYVAFNLNRSKEGRELSAITSSVQSREITNSNSSSGSGRSIFGLKFK